MANSQLPFPSLTADEAAALIPHDSTVAFSGFTPAGAPKAVPVALARRANERHAAGDPFRIRVLTGASTGPSVDEALAQANAIAWRAPYQASPTLRQQLNAGDVDFVDMHLSHVPGAVLAGFFGKVHVAVVEATEVTADGKVYLTSAIGATPTYLHVAEKVIVEINRFHTPRLRDIADVTILPPPPHRNPVPVHTPLSKVGWPYAVVDPAKIVGIVETNQPDEVKPMEPNDPVYGRIADHIADFLLAEMHAGRIAGSFMPLQCGLGHIANHVLHALGDNPDIPPFTMYTEVFQDACMQLMRTGKITAASATSLTLSPGLLREFMDDMSFFAPRMLLRPQELSNHAGIIRRLGVISINTALEVDIYGHANSTHVCGTDMINGIGGSGDFTRNSFLSIFICPSVAKEGRISTIVPMASHVDHNEHSVNLIATEWGLADLRGLAPAHRAQRIINQCAHPAYRPYLNDYLASARAGHLRHNLQRAFELHLNLQQHGHMLPGITL